MTELHAEISARLGSAAPAVALGRAGDLSYADLARRAAALSAQFEGIQPGQSVGILSTRCWEAYAAVLASFFTGRCFVPLNPDLPFDRLAKIVAQGQVNLVVHDKGNTDLAMRLNVPAVDPNLLNISDTTLHAGTFPNPDAIVYQMFTSGSTGNPKGVPVRYDSLAHYVKTVRPAVGLTEPGRFSQLFDLSFDLAMHDIFIALANGGTIVPAGQMDMLMPHSYIGKKKIDHWFSVPMLAKVAARGANGVAADHRLTTALFCGEPLPMAYARDFRQFVSDGADIYNLYGPTEATIAFTAKPVDFTHDMAGIVPLGVPFGDNRVAVEDESGSVVDLAEGIEGELLLGGPQVFDGYRPAINTDCFTQSSPVFYRSGDLVRMVDGELHHLGRTDSQIKLRGYRIELGDIEAAVRRAFGLETLACVVAGEGEGRQIMLAYVADMELADLTPLDEHLPDYMKPQLWTRLDQMPLNVNGKIDRKALGAMGWPK
jgi:amino acid adenylation domain-containing protein